MADSVKVRRLTRSEHRMLAAKLKDRTLRVRVHRRYRVIAEVASGGPWPRSPTAWAATSAWRRAEVRAGPATAARGSARRSLAREPGAGPRTQGWKRIFLEQGTRGLKTRSDPEERELTLARAKFGELMMRLELAEHLIEKRELTDEWKNQRR